MIATGGKQMAGTKARTERGDFLFKVSIYGDKGYSPFISTEPRRITTSLVGKDGFVAFDLKTKDFEEAERIADFLNEHIERIAFTIFEGHPMFNVKPPNE